MKQLQLLKKYQDLEQIEKEAIMKLKSLPQVETLRGLKQEIEEQQELLKSVKDEVNKLEKKVKEQEFTLEEYKKEIKSLTSKLFSGETSNLKELEGLDLKKKGIEEQVSQIEDIIIGHLDRIDQVKSNLIEKSQVLKETKVRFRSLLDVYQKEKEALKSQIAEIPEVRNRLADQIDKNLMREYNDKKLKFGRKVIVETKGQTCQGCNLSVAFQVLKQLKAQEDISYCDKCGRILLMS